MWNNFLLDLLNSERFLESSGTEGDSSQQSVVYLHATTVGHIPQPYVASSRRSSKSREELNSIKTKSSAQSPVQPMTRTVSRSVSMLAPWTPKHISDGYEINYSQTMQNSKVIIIKTEKNTNDIFKWFIFCRRSRRVRWKVRKPAGEHAPETIYHHCGPLQR